MGVSFTSIPSSLPHDNVISFIYSNPLPIPSNPLPKSLHIPSTYYNYLNPSRIHMPTNTYSNCVFSTLVQTITRLQQELSHLTQI